MLTRFGKGQDGAFFDFVTRHLVGISRADALARITVKAEVLTNQAFWPRLTGETPWTSR
jgi:hypothetical protein